ncbi:hypothetical protein AJ80_06112 [Polytolypa hystricis UAMH7299]|uniref:Uncharacterized protein n=1 Tax=Polytolypa hystricis (strain UAMH7299) TaxID=1447883 RepID=A0A2B7XZB7_POLH7|nr:hypothetical protein AJ80_06112 [Polytolypa hystricis UAMH7299]
MDNPGSETRKAQTEWSQSQQTSGKPSSSTHQQAPSYVDPIVHNMGSTKPKGQNLTEGGFDDDPAHNASFTSEIGTEQDPGRAAELQYEKEMSMNPNEAAEPAGGWATGKATKANNKKAGQPYESLAEEEA